MNYILRLQMENEALRAEKAESLAACADLTRYLTSTKFHADTTVQVGDIHDRLAPIRSPLFEAQS